MPTSLAARRLPLASARARPLRLAALLGIPTAIHVIYSPANAARGAGAARGGRRRAGGAHAPAGSVACFVVVLTLRTG